VENLRTKLPKLATALKWWLDDKLSFQPQSWAKTEMQRLQDEFEEEYACEMEEVTQTQT